MIIVHLWAKVPGDYFFIATKSGSGQWKEHFFSRRDITKNHGRKVRQFLEEHSDKDLYFCPHGFSQPRRKKEFAVRPKMLWADLDEADPRTINPKPTIAFESSPGRHVGLWLTNFEMTEDINRQLTYAIGADRGGWDLTQVLRIPGTRNYKYQTTPRVRILWDDGPTWQKKKLLALLPDDEAEREVSVDLDAAEVFKHYERKLPPDIRSMIQAKKLPVNADRSKQLWIIINECLTAGMTSDECFAVLWPTVWNKWAERRNGEDQLYRDIDKVRETRMSAKPLKAVEREEDQDADDPFTLRTLDQVEEEELDWLWYPYLARGEISILEGDPGLGKSYLAQMIAKHICDGIALPCEHEEDEKKVLGKVLYFDIENSAGSVTKKRMKWNGLKSYRNFAQFEYPFSLDDPELMERVEEMIESFQPTLIVFDTLNTYVGGSDTSKGNEIQQTLGVLRMLAQRHNCAALILRHLTKNTKDGKALYRGQGSMSIAGMARVIMTMGHLPNPDDDEPLLAFGITKINVAPRGKARIVEIVPLQLPGERHASRLEFGDLVDASTDDMVSPQKSEKEKGPSAKEKAKEFLENQLDDGPVEVTKLQRMADKNSHNWATVERAAKDLGVLKKQKLVDGVRVSKWELP